MNKNIKPLLLSSLLLANSLALALTPPTTPASVSSASVVQPASEPAKLQRYSQELERIKQHQRDTLLLKQQLEAEKLQAELAKQRGGQLGNTTPYVLALTGVGKQRMARLGVNGVGEVSVRAGERLPGGWQILSISDQAVTARQPDGSRVILPFYAH